MKGGCDQRRPVHALAALRRQPACDGRPRCGPTPAAARS